MITLHEIDSLIIQDYLFRLIRSKNKAEVITLILERQQKEIKNNKNFNDKKTDLIIWNALLLKEVITTGQTQLALVPIYSAFIEEIQQCQSFQELITLELKIFDTYLDIIILETETTNHLLVNKILQHLYINIENYQNIQSICSALNISMSHASKIFKEHTGISIMRYSKQLKIERAKTLLLYTNDSLLTISERLGFYDQGHFSRTFKSIVGVSPIHYRNYQQPKQ